MQENNVPAEIEEVIKKFDSEYHNELRELYINGNYVQNIFHLISDGTEVHQALYHLLRYTSSLEDYLQAIGGPEWHIHPKILELTEGRLLRDI